MNMSQSQFYSLLKMSEQHITLLVKIFVSGEGSEDTLHPEVPEDTIIVTCWGNIGAIGFV